MQAPKSQHFTRDSDQIKHKFGEGASWSVFFPWKAGGVNEVTTGYNWLKKAYRSLYPVKDEEKS